MRYFYLLFITGLLIGFSSSIHSQNSYNSNDRITFHQVNLVCGAANDIGCGSRSKPILLDLEKQNTIQEAWLNRPGTKVAVVWQEDYDPNVAEVKEVFKKHKKSIKLLEGDEYQEQLKSFNNERWYRGSEVDELSIEEAGRITDQIINPLLEAEFLTKEDAPGMHAEIEEYIKNQFLTLEDVSLLSKRAYYLEWEKEIQQIARGYISEENIPKIKIVGSSFWRRIVIYGSIAIVLLAGVFIYRRRQLRPKVA